MIGRLMRFVMVIMIFNGVLFALTTTEMVRNAHAQLDLHRIRAHIYRTLGDLQDVETGQRGYMLTGQKEFLEPCDRGMKSFPGDVAFLAAILPEKEEKALAVRLGREGADKVTYARNLIREFDENPELDLRPRNDVQGKRLMDQCRKTAAELIAYQDVAFERTTGKYGRTPIFVFCSFLISYSLVLLLSFWVLKLSRLQPESDQRLA